MKLLIVSNRLPVTVIQRKGELSFRESVGGLVSGLRPYLASLETSTDAPEPMWIGWPGIAAPETVREEIKARLSSEFQAYPVFLNKGLVDNFYRGFCNRTIWPLFHYFPEYAEFKEEYWRAYQRANAAFRDAILKIVRPGDSVWVHDYHLMLLPGLLRQSMRDLSVGYFHHIPFPSFEIFRLLPRRWGSEILEGLLGADLIGFHTVDYTQYFLRSVLRVLGLEQDRGQILVDDRLVNAETLPLGVDFEKFSRAADGPQVKRERSKLMEALKGLKVILSIDRLDYTKGIVNRLEGYEAFLRRQPRWRGRVVLLLVVVPSRTGVRRYREMKEQIDELVGNINGRYGDVSWTPILYQYGHQPFVRLAAMYVASHAALVTPLRDGMNLIAKEYITARKGETGVLILSEMAGASRELGEAILVNPTDREEIAQALGEALEMSPEEQIERNEAMYGRLKRHDALQWGENFIEELRETKLRQRGLYEKFLGHREREELARSYGKSRRRLIFLDYDGTLIPFSPDPLEARPSETVLELLRKLSIGGGTQVVLTSGRSKDTLEEWFAGLPLGLVAEHGAWMKRRGQAWKVIKPLRQEWKTEIRPLLETYVERLPGSFIEEKEFSIVWHYRASDPEMGTMRARELSADLTGLTAGMDVQVLQGRKILEIRNAGVDKGSAALQWISQDDFDFIMSVGDDWTDEELFSVLPESAWSIRVGMVPSFARFRLRGPMEVSQLLEQLART